MKKREFLLGLFILMFSLGFAQVLDDIDYISPFNEGLAAIKKNNQWGFINKNGNIVVDFRNDLVTTKTDDGDYPIFKNNRCLIVNKKESIAYFGYINASGKTVILPQFLNASNFNKNTAIVLKLQKKSVGKNTLLGKNVVYHRYYDVLIDLEGNIKEYLTQDGKNVVLDKKQLRKPPKIMSKMISDNLFISKNQNGKLTIKKIE